MSIDHVTTRRIAIVAGALALAAGCSQSESSSATTDAEAATTVAPATTAAPPTTEAPAPTTTDADVATSTSEPTTTIGATSTTVVESTTTSEVPVTTAPPPAGIPASAIVTLDPELVEMDVASGEVLRVIDEFFEGDGIFRSALQIAPDGSTAWFSEGYEDGWYSCESSVGGVARIDLATGAIENVAAGTSPSVSPDGADLAFVASGVCVPDPQEPDFWVLTPYDRLIVRELETGRDRVIGTSPAPEDYESPSQILWAGHSPGGNLLVMTGDGDVRLVDPDGPSLLQSHPVVLTGVEGFPVAATDDALVVSVTGDEGAVELVAVNALSGERALLATSERFITVGVDGVTGQLLAAGFAEIVVEPGAPVTVLPLPGDVFVGTLDW